jgi:hypothetical protein
VSETPPFLARVGGTGRYRFHAADGQVYAVYDVVFERGKLRPLQLGSRRATTRLFRPASGMWRTYRFPDSEKREPDVFDLERQLRAATYYSPEPINIGERRPW